MINLILRKVFKINIGWVNVYKRKDGGLHISSLLYSSKEQAKKSKCGKLEFVGTKGVWVK